MDGSGEASVDASGSYVRLSEAVRTMKENLVYMQEPKAKEESDEEEAPSEAPKCSCGHSHGESEPGFFRHKGFLANAKWAIEEYRNSFKPLQAVPSIDYFRADLQVRFRARQVWVKGEQVLRNAHQYKACLQCRRWRGEVGCNVPPGRGTFQ